MSNPNFQHPEDGWYQIEVKGEHPNRAAGVVQLIDDTAIRSIVNRFNATADAPNFPGMLIDHEHFKNDPDKETTAYGWLMKLQARADGIYGKIRWTSTGQAAVDGGTYRFFSTEYDPGDLQIVNRDNPKKVRPLQLDGLTLTNDPNNKGGRPITNRRSDPKTPPAQDMKKQADSIMNRARELQKQTRMPFASAVVQAQREAEAQTPAERDQAAIILNRAAELQRKNPHLSAPSAVIMAQREWDAKILNRDPGAGNDSGDDDTDDPTGMDRDAATKAFCNLVVSHSKLNRLSFNEAWEKMKQSHPKLYAAMEINAPEDAAPPQ